MAKHVKLKTFLQKRIELSLIGGLRTSKLSHYFVVSTKKGQGKQGQLETILNLLQILAFLCKVHI